MAHVRPNHRFTHRPFHHGLEPKKGGDAPELGKPLTGGNAFVPKHRGHKKDHRKILPPKEVPPAPKHHRKRHK